MKTCIKGNILHNSVCDRIWNNTMNIYGHTFMFGLLQMKNNITPMYGVYRYWLRTY